MTIARNLDGRKNEEKIKWCLYEYINLKSSEKKIWRILILKTCRGEYSFL